MKGQLMYILVMFMLCFTIADPVASSFIKGDETSYISDLKNILSQDSGWEGECVSIRSDERSYGVNPMCDVDIPWKREASTILEWWIVVEYNGQQFEKLVPLYIADFSEKFLKHPDYGEKIRFDIDDDPEDDIEVIAGFYWSVVKDEAGNDVESLEKRIRFRQLESGGYVDDPEGDLTVWSEIHINYGLFAKKGKSKSLWNHDSFPLFFDKQSAFKKTLPYLLTDAGKNPIMQYFNWLLLSVQNSVFELFFQPSVNDVLIDEDDYISVGLGYRSGKGEPLPRYLDKRFSFGRNEIFSPSIFQHSVDPGPSKGQTSFETLYAFQSYKGGSVTPVYDIEFSVEIIPAVFMKTKFIPVDGVLFCYFDETSQRNNPTNISFTSNVIKGIGEDFSLCFIIDSINDSLGRSGRWMSFDVDLLGDFDVFGGNIQYRASNRFSIGMVIDSQFFEEKIQVNGIPTLVDIVWDVDFLFSAPPTVFAHVEGFVDISMNDDLESFQLFYPSTDGSQADKVFIDVPLGIPMDSRFEVVATADVDLLDLQSSSNYVFGKIKHTCSNTIDMIQAFLPDRDEPVIKVTDIPSFAEAKGKLHWGNLHGYASMIRGYDAVCDPVEIDVQYQDFKIHNVLTIRNGFIETRFKLSDNGYFFFDTSEGIFGTDLFVSNEVTGDSIDVFVDEVSADDLRLDWDIDTSGESLKINEFHFNGMLDTLKGFESIIDYQGKSTAVSMNWLLRKEGFFDIFIDQQDDITLDFSQFALNSSEFHFDGGITLSDTILFDMCWDLKQGQNSSSGNVDPGFFSINKNNDQALIKDFEFYLTYQDKYGVDVSFENLVFYLDLEWWKGNRLLPYVWLDYEVSADDFDVDLLWTNGEGSTQWYENVEDW